MKSNEASQMVRPNGEALEIPLQNRRRWRQDQMTMEGSNQSTSCAGHSWCIRILECVDTICFDCFTCLPLFIAYRFWYFRFSHVSWDVGLRTAPNLGDTRLPNGFVEQNVCVASPVYTVTSRWPQTCAVWQDIVTKRHTFDKIPKGRECDETWGNMTKLGNSTVWNAWSAWNLDRGAQLFLLYIAQDSLVVLVGYYVGPETSEQSPSCNQFKHTRAHPHTTNK
jgi:hypothetical protein